MARRSAVRVSTAAAAALLLTLAPGAAAKPAAGPETAKCGKLKRKVQKKKCLKQNQANRIAFNQIKNSRFVGTRGDGEEVDAIYCANGKFESRLTGRYGTGVSSGRRWRIADAKVRRGGKWIDAFLRGPEGYEIGLQRRGAQWKIGVTSFDRIIEAGEMTKTNAAGDCATLAV